MNAHTPRSAPGCLGTRFLWPILRLAVAVIVSLPTLAVVRQEAVPEIPAGAEHTCGVGFGGSVQCWGTNYSGQLGDGTNIDRNTPVAVAGLTSGVTAIAAGAEHTCAVISGGVRCWGANFSGQLGDGTNVNRNTPSDVVGSAASVVAIVAGGSHACALSSVGGVRCWGANFSGQLGDGTNISSNTPVEASGLSSGVTAIAAGAEHTCAVRVGGVRCWGANRSGQLGDGTNVHRNSPVDVSGSTSRRPWVHWRWL